MTDRSDICRRKPHKQYLNFGKQNDDEIIL